MPIFLSFASLILLLKFKLIIKKLVFAACAGKGMVCWCAFVFGVCIWDSQFNHSEWAVWIIHMQIIQMEYIKEESGLKIPFNFRSIFFLS